MRSFVDAAGTAWVATAREENTPRHHGRWYLVFQSEADAGTVYPMPEVRWQTAETAERTLLTMSTFELRRRLDNVLRRTSSGAKPAASSGA